ncbi:hypothetical protein GCM10010254_30020 [Streptomyces chromofuscus]|nr:hypothetical protein GCM10010254_30020 [Streptomyces chromofuscus]
MALTTLVITATALLEGVLVGLVAGVVLAALRMSQAVVRPHVDDDTARVVMAGNATLLRLPRLIEALERAAAAGKPRIRLDLLGVTHLDHACRTRIDEFVAQQPGAGLRVELLMPDPTAGTKAPAAGGTVADVAGRTADVSGRTDAGGAVAGAAGEGGPGTYASPGLPGPTAEWFHLDTSALPGARDRVS